MVKDAPKVSVCIPTYNRADYLKIALNSVICQTYNNIEIIISDNCSTDNTQKMVEGIKDNRIIYHKFLNPVPPIRNWNNCVELSSGEYITFLTDDDIMEKSYVETLLELITMDKHISLARSGLNIIDENGKEIGYFNPFPHKETARDFIFYRLAGKRSSFLPGYLFRRSDFFAVGGIVDTGFDRGLFTDDYLWFRIALKNKYLISTQERLWSYREHIGHLGFGINLARFHNNIPNYINLIHDLVTEYGFDEELISFLKDVYPEKLIVTRIRTESERSRKHSLYRYLKFLIINYPIILRYSSIKKEIKLLLLELKTILRKSRASSR